jgi:DNA-binding GntR family transcriptional regulator
VAPPKQSIAGKSETRPTADGVYTAMKEMILSFELHPGARFTESEIAARFGVSRTPVREALQRLQSEHYVNIRSKQGCFVRDIDIADLTQRYQVRIELEMLSLQLACLHMPDQALEKLAAEWDPALQRHGPSRPDLMLEREESFHLALAAGGGNGPLHAYIKDINQHIRIVRRLDFTSPERVASTYQEHHRIARLLLGRELKAAQRMMRQHISQSMEFAKTLTLVKLAQLRSRGGSRR